MSNQSTTTQRKIISADDLRAQGAMISKAVSWERTAMNLLWQLRNNAKIKHFLQFQRLLVTFGGEGAIYIETRGGAIQNPAYLYLKHGRNEGFVRCSKIVDRSAIG